MRITFKKQHLSISQFDPVNLAEFTLLTGVNGSGKTHLLQAIKNGSVEVQNIDTKRIVYFDYHTFRLENETVFQSSALPQDYNSAWAFFEANVLPEAKRWNSNLKLVDDSQSNKKVSFYERSECASYRIQVDQFFESRATSVHAKQFKDYCGIYALAKKISKPLHELQKAEFLDLYVPYQLLNDFLPKQLGKIFLNYHQKHLNNAFNGFRNSNHGLNLPTLSDEEFTAKHGRSPWDMVNEILATFDSMYYRVNSPIDLSFHDPFHLKLQHLSSPSLEVEFDKLSSGERILMAIVGSIYKASSDSLFPELLLLDEIDASLHPSMMRGLLSWITRNIIPHGTKVIMVTHSPTTIALAPENSVFLMNRDGSNRIEKCDNSKALSVLTEGFATLDQGLKLFDDVACNPITIITEGNNASILRKALELFDVHGVHVLAGIESYSGKSQLETLFKFFANVPHRNKVIFVWDCDVKNGLKEQNQTYPFILPFNIDNTVVKKGIENAFPETALEGYLNSTKEPDGQVHWSFGSSYKSKFADNIVKQGTRADFEHFKHLVEELNRIKALSLDNEISA